VSFPVEVRFAAADTVALSTAHGRDSAYVAVHVPARSDHRSYFGDVEALMRDHDGRPHWGKMHSLGVGELSCAYPRWGDFTALRDEMDPERRFANAHLTSLLGS
jgi:FAD/FMN-containing dehydrogenase